MCFKPGASEIKTHSFLPGLYTSIACYDLKEHYSSVYARFHIFHDYWTNIKNYSRKITGEIFLLMSLTDDVITHS